MDAVIDQLAYKTLSLVEEQMPEAWSFFNSTLVNLKQLVTIHDHFKYLLARYDNKEFIAKCFAAIFSYNLIQILSQEETLDKEKLEIFLEYVEFIHSNLESLSVTIFNVIFREICRLIEGCKRLKSILSIYELFEYRSQILKEKIFRLIEITEKIQEKLCELKNRALEEDLSDEEILLINRIDQPYSEKIISYMRIEKLRRLKCLNELNLNEELKNKIAKCFDNPPEMKSRSSVQIRTFQFPTFFYPGDIREIEFYSKLKINEEIYQTTDQKKNTIYFFKGINGDEKVLVVSICFASSNSYIKYGDLYEKYSSNVISVLYIENNYFKIEEKASDKKTEVAVKTDVSIIKIILKDCDFLDPMHNIENIYLSLGDIFDKIIGMNNENLYFNCIKIESFRVCRENKLFLADFSNLNPGTKDGTAEKNQLESLKKLLFAISKLFRNRLRDDKYIRKLRYLSLDPKISSLDTLKTEYDRINKLDFS